MILDNWCMQEELERCLSRKCFKTALFNLRNGDHVILNIERCNMHLNGSVLNWNIGSNYICMPITNIVMATFKEEDNV